MAIRLNRAFGLGKFVKLRINTSNLSVIFSVKFSLTKF